MAMSPDPESQRTWIDVTDLIEYLRSHNVVSGVQRVVVETIVEFDRSGNSFSVCAFDPSRMRFVVVPTSDVLEMFQHLRGRADNSGRKKSRSLATGLQSQLYLNPVAEPTPGDVLAVLGAAWSVPAIFVGINKMRRAGTRVLVLIYDLIPMAIPNVPEVSLDQFRTYLEWVSLLADRVAFISDAVKTEFRTVTKERANIPELGSTTGLPPGLEPASFKPGEVDPVRPWSRPYILIVGSIEARKSHLVALHAWRELCDRLGRDAVPDLLCAGRVGWGAIPFLRERREDPVLRERVHLPVSDVSDIDLYRLYRDCEFTVFPSVAEGWGLPVSESIAFGKPVICSDIPPLREAGGDAAIYVPPNDSHELARAIESLVREQPEADLAKRIASHDQITWTALTATIATELRETRHIHQLDRPERQLTTNIEYPLAIPKSYDGVDSGDGYLHFQDRVRAMPLTGLPGTPEAGVVGRLAAELGGTLKRRATTHLGIPLTPTNWVTWNAGALREGSHLLIAATNATPGAEFSADASGSPLRVRVLNQSLIVIDLADVSGDNAVVQLKLSGGSKAGHSMVTHVISFVILGGEADRPAAATECVSAMLTNAAGKGAAISRTYKVLHRRVGRLRASRESRVKNFTQRARNKAQRLRRGSTSSMITTMQRANDEPFVPSIHSQLPAGQSLENALQQLSLQLQTNTELKRAVSALQAEEHQIRTKRKR